MTDARRVCERHSSLVCWGVGMRRICVFGGGVEEGSDVWADVGRGFNIAGVVVEDAVGR